MFFAIVKINFGIFLFEINVSRYMEVSPGRISSRRLRIKFAVQNDWADAPGLKMDRKLICQVFKKWHDPEKVFFFAKHNSYKKLMHNKGPRKKTEHK